MTLKTVCHRFLDLLGVSSIFRKDRHLELERCTFSRLLPPIETFRNSFQNFNSISIGSLCLRDIDCEDLKLFWKLIGETVVEVDASRLFIEGDGVIDVTEQDFLEIFSQGLSAFTRLQKLWIQYTLVPIFVSLEIILPEVEDLIILNLSGDFETFDLFASSLPKLKRIYITSIDDYSDWFDDLLTSYASKIKSLGRDIFKIRFNGESFWQISPEMLMNSLDLQLEELDCKRISLDVRAFINKQKRLKRLTTSVTSFPIPVAPVTHLNLSHIHVALLDPCLEQYRTLESLTFTAQGYDPEAIECIFKHTRKSLKELNIYDFHFRGCFLSDWQLMPRLEVLGLFSVAEVSVKGIRHLCRTCPKLNNLRLMGQFRGDPDRIVETIVRELPDLEVLEIRLYEAGATNLTFDYIAKYGRNLKMLGLGENEMEILSSAKKYWLFKQLPLLREIRDFGSNYSKTRRTDYLSYSNRSEDGGEVTFLD